MFPVPAHDRRFSSSLRFSSSSIRIVTQRRLQFIDMTERLIARIAPSGITEGIINIQTRHTTTGIVVNEGEPLLLEDFEDLLRLWVRRAGDYRHDDLQRRTVNLEPGERPNGDAHARALLLGCSESLNIAQGVLQLGRWQRIFLVELDGPRTREISVTLLGVGTGKNDNREPLHKIGRRAGGTAS